MKRKMSEKRGMNAYPSPFLLPSSPLFYLSKFAIQNESLKTDRQITVKHVLSLDCDVIYKISTATQPM